MNDLIRELAKEASFKNQDEESIPYFAELIVRECLRVLDKAQWDKGQDWELPDGTGIIPYLEDHFGIIEIEE